LRHAKSEIATQIEIHVWLLRYIASRSAASGESADPVAPPRGVGFELRLPFARPSRRAQRGTSVEVSRTRRYGGSGVTFISPSWSQRSSSERRIGSSAPSSSRAGRRHLVIRRCGRASRDAVCSRSHSDRTKPACSRGAGPGRRCRSDIRHVTISKRSGGRARSPAAQGWSASSAYYVDNIRSEAARRAREIRRPALVLAGLLSCEERAFQAPRPHTEGELSGERDARLKASRSKTWRYPRPVHVRPRADAGGCENRLAASDSC